MCRVLILDDEPDFGQIIKQIIETADEGRPDVVATEAEALSAAAKAQRRGKPYEVFLIDQRLGPGKDGIEVLKDLRRLCPESDAIIFTGYEDTENGLRAYQAGAFRYISKPFRNEELLFLLKQIKEWRKETREHVWQKIFSQMIEETLRKSSFQNTAEIVVKHALKLGFTRAHLFWVPRYEEANFDNEMIGIASAGHGGIKHFGRAATRHVLYPLTRWFDLGSAHDVICVRPGELPDIASQMAKYGYKWPVGECAILPVRSSTRLLGAMVLDHGSHPHSLSEHEHTMLNFFARQVSLALENASLYIQERRSREEADVISTVGKEVSARAANNDMHALLAEVRTHLSKLMDASDMSLILCHEETGELEIHRMHESARRYTVSHRPAGSGLEGYLVNHQAGIAPVRDIPGFKQQRHIDMVGSLPQEWMGAPLIVADVVIGALTLQHFSNDPRYTQRDWQLLVAVANQIAGAIQLNRLRQNEKRESERLNVLKRATGEMLRVAQRDEADLWLTALTIATANYGTGLNRALLFLENASHTALVLASAIGTDDAEKAHHDWERDIKHSYEFDHFLQNLDQGRVALTDFARLAGQIVVPLNDKAPDALNEVMHTGVLAIVREPELLTRLPHELTDRVSLAECAIVPLRAGTRTIGVMVVDNKHNKIKLKQSALFRLQTTLGYAGLVKETLRQQEKSESLLDANYQIMSGANHETLQATLTRICQTARTITEADWVIIYPFQEGIDVFDIANVAHAGEISLPLSEVIVDKPGKSGFSHYVLTHEQLVIDNIAESRLPIVKRLKESHFIKKEQVQALIGIPIQDPLTDQTLGLLYLDYRKLRTFTDQEIHHAHSFASLAAVAINNARRFDQEQQHKRLRVAQSIAEVANRAVDQDEMFSQTLEELRGLFKGASMCILTYEEIEKALRFAPSTLNFYRLADMEITEDLVFPLSGPSIACCVARESLARQVAFTLNVPDIAANKDYLKLIATSRSELCVGLMDSEKDLLGVLALERDSTFGFSEEDEDLVQIVAFQLSQGLERIRKNDELTFKQTVATMTAWAADMAHDIKNEVGTIKMSAYYIREFAQSRAEVLESVGEIEKSARNLADADPQASRKKQDVLLDDLIKKFAYPLAHDRSIELECLCAADDCYINVNPIAMKRVLRHLTRNADRAMQDKQGKKIVIHTFKLDQDNVEIHFQDFGSGVSEAVQSSLFWKSITTKTSKDVGGGHGLLFTRQLVEDMDGTIRLLRSEPGRGATFAIRLPISKVHDIGADL